MNRLILSTLLAVQLTAALVLLAITFTVQAKPWKTTEYGEPFVLSTIDANVEGAEYTAMIITDWTMTNDGIHEARAVTFAGHKLDFGKSGLICAVSATVDGKVYRTHGITKSGGGGLLPTVMVMDSTDPEYREKVPDSAAFIDNIKKTQGSLVVIKCGGEMFPAYFKPDVSYNEMKKAQ